MEEIKIPDLGGFNDVEVIEIPVSPGQSVEEDETILVLETDKATMEVPAPFSGVIHEIKVKEGDKVNEGDAVASMEGGNASTSEQDTGEVAESSLEPAPEVATDAVVEQVSVAQDVTTDLDVTIPDLGGASGVSVIEVPVEVGQSVEEEDTLLVLETDKATMEIPAPQAGIIKSLEIAVGGSVDEGQRVAVLEVTSSVTPAGLSVSGSSEKAASTENAKVTTPHADSLSKVESPAAVSSPAVEPVRAKTKGAGGSIYAGPAVRKLAREFGISIPEVLGKIGASGPKGRVLKEDLQEYVKQRLSEPADTGVKGGMGIEPIPAQDFEKFGPVRREELSRIQKISSQHLHRCWLNVPHVTQFDEADITDLEAFRKEVNSSGQYEQKLTLIPFLVKAVEKVLKEMPRFNASITPEGDALILKEYYNIGVAVDTPNGLMVPVIKDVDNKSVLEIAAQAKQYAGEARAGKLKPDALQGSCFSISSLGGIGGTQFTPIVNAPEVAILGVSKADIKPVWQTDDQGVAGWQPRLILPLALSYDHRVVDGVLACQFTTRLKQLLEDSRHLLL